MSGTDDGKDVAVLLTAYHYAGSKIAQHETEIADLRHQQALLIGLMHAYLPYRVLAPMLGLSKSRVEQLNKTALRTTAAP